MKANLHPKSRIETLKIRRLFCQGGASDSMKRFSNFGPSTWFRACREIEATGFPFLIRRWRALSLFLAVCAMLLSPSGIVHAQQAQRIFKIGRLGAGSSSDPLSKAAYAAFRDGLRELGWIEGKNFTIENR